jgi:hypothetical protein
MIFLIGWSDFNVRYHVNTRRKVDFGVFVDAADGRHLVSVLHCELLKKGLQRVKAVVDVVLVGIAAYNSN